MSDQIAAGTARSTAPAPAPAPVTQTTAGRSRWQNSTTFSIGLLLVLGILPFFLDEFWLRTGFAVFGAIVGATGLSILVGSTGQLSLGHAFFLGVGAVTYSWLSGDADDAGGGAVSGLHLPPLVAMVLAVLAAGAAGLVVSPVAARVRGIYLGVASLGLVFVGQYAFIAARSVTGGFGGRLVHPFSFFGFSFSDTDPQLSVLGAPFTQATKLWYLGLVLAGAGYLFARSLLATRPGRAMRAIRDNEVVATISGVDVRSWRAKAFLISSMYAGLAGVLYALSIGTVAPDPFSLNLSVQYIIMIMIGGLGSLGGAVFGATLVTALPLLLDQYSTWIPGLSQPGSGGVSYAEMTRYFFGAIVILVVLFQPSGVAGLARRLRRPRPGS